MYNQIETSVTCDQCTLHEKTNDFAERRNYILFLLVSQLLNVDGVMFTDSKFHFVPKVPKILRKRKISVRMNR